MIESIYSHLKNEEVQKAVMIQSAVRMEMKKFLNDKGFVEIPPVIISPLTDPLRHEVYEAVINYYGYRYSLTKSMIFHKQLALLSFDKIFSFSPNIRLEPFEKASTGRHLAEFTQLDIEIRGAKREDVMALIEDMILQIIKNLKKKYEISIKIPKKPFERITFEEAFSEYGENFETLLSQDKEEPFWIIDMPIHKREFYDYEYKPGILRDMDLVYPFGFGEAASGGEREYEYGRIIERIRKGGYNLEDFELYLELVKRGVPPSAGIGIGIERLTRYLCNLDSVEYATLFPKRIGVFSV